MRALIPPKHSTNLAPVHRYVHTVTLGSVRDPLDSASIWSKRSLFGAIFLRDEPLLKGALLQHSVRSGRGTKRTYAHVELWLPLEVVEDDRRVSRGSRVGALIADLTERHANELGKFLSGKAPRYAVRGVPGLSPGSIVARFGEGIYVAAPEEEAAWKIETSVDGGIIWTPTATLHDACSLTVLGPRLTHASATLPDWPFGANSLVMMEVDERLEISAEPVGSLLISVDPQSGIHAVRLPPGTQAEGGAEAVTLLVRASRHPRAAKRPAPAAYEARMETRPVFVRASPEPAHSAGSSRIEPREAHTEPADSEDGSATYFAESTVLQSVSQVAESMAGIDGTCSGTIFFSPPEQRVTHTLTLAGVALPRPLRCAADSTIEIGLTAQARITDARNAPLVIGVDLQDHLYVRTRAGSRPLTAGETLPLGTGQIRIEAPPPGGMPDTAALLIFDPAPLSAGLAADSRLFFGRKSIAAANLRALKDIQVKVRGRTAEFERLGFSGEHFAFIPTTEGLRVDTFARSTLVHLDADLVPIHRYESDASLVVNGSELLLAGCYLLRYEMS